MDPNGRLVLVGAGNMGGALLRGWVGAGIDPERIVVLDPSPPRGVKALLDEHGIALNPPPGAIDAPGIVLIAVEPRIVPAVLPGLKTLVGRETLVISIAAGCGIAVFEAAFGCDRPVIRAMPNMPAACGCAMTVLCANARAGASGLVLAEGLFGAIGATGRVDDEALLDAVTAVSGSGPAYVFYLTECLARAGIGLGLPEQLAIRLARQTVYGAGKLMHDGGEDAGLLRRNVTSAGGTTQAGLGVLMADDGLRALMAAAVKAAAKRSRELAR